MKKSIIFILAFIFVLIGCSTNSVVIENKDEYSYLKITTNKDDVKIFIDGNEIGTIGSEKKLNKKVKSGYHEIECRKEYYIPTMMMINLKENEVKPINFLLFALDFVQEELEIIAMSQGNGNLTIATEKIGYTVTIGDIHNTAPIEFRSFPAGAYLIDIKRNGVSRKIRVEIKIDENTFIDLDELYNE